jgi:hypothetical protein
MTNASRLIEQITISYIVISNSHPRLMMDSFVYPGSPLSPADYSLVGCSGFNRGVIGIRYYGITINSILLNCVGTCSNSCISKSNCSRVTNSVIRDKNCFICPSGTQFN